MIRVPARPAEQSLPPLLLAPHRLIYGRGDRERQAPLARALRRAAKLLRS